MQQLAGSDAIFLSLETATTHAHIGGVFLIEPVSDDFGFARFKQHCAERLPLAPRFTSKLREVPLGLDRPYFVEDPDFDVSNHLRRVAVPSPGGLRDLAELVGDLYAPKLDRRRPLWEMWWIEGLADGRIAILTKTHHCLIDGMSGVGLAELLCDLQPDPPPRATGPRKPRRVREREPSDLELYLGGLWHTFGTPLRVARYLGQAAARGVALIPYARQSSLSVSVPKVSFNADIGPRRSVAWTTVPLSDVRAIKKHFDVKVNDVVLALCSSAVRRYLLAQNELPKDPLVVSVPVSTRSSDDKELGNQVASMMVGWATDLDDPIERLRRIQENTAHAKEMTRAVRAREIQAMGDTLAPAVLNLAYRMIAATSASAVPANAVVSNVPGSPIPVYLAGGRLEATYPVSIIMPGMGLNVTVLSYVDRVDFGFTVDPDLVPDPWYLSDGIPIALEELKDAAGIDRAVPLRPAPLAASDDSPDDPTGDPNEDPTEENISV